MNARITAMWLAVAGSPVVAVAQSAPQSVQYAKTLAACSAATNAAAGATVYNTIICNGVSKEDKAQITEAKQRSIRAEKIAKLALDTAKRGLDKATFAERKANGTADGLAAIDRKFELYKQTVDARLAALEGPTATTEDRQIVAQLEKGDSAGAAALIRAQAERVQTSSPEQAAVLYLQEANLLAFENVRGALQAAERAVAVDPANIRALWTAGDLALLAGDSNAAKRHYEQMRDVVEMALKNQPQDRNLLRYLSISYDNVGDVLLPQGNAPAALKAYQDGLAIRERLAKADLSNAQAQRDLSISYDRISDVWLRQGNSAAALKAYQDGLATRKRLAKADPFNAQAQRDLSVSYSKIGNALLQKGDLPAALKTYKDALAISKRLAKDDQSNAEAQRDLSAYYDKVGDVLLLKGNVPAALKAYQKALEIRKRAAKADLSNARAQQDLSFSYRRLAATALLANDKAGAIKQSEIAEAILVALLARVGDNAEYTRDLADIRWALARLKAQ